jgi:hypothetical protein
VEKDHYLDPYDPKDGSTLNKNGYTNLENYLHSLVNKQGH